MHFARMSKCQSGIERVHPVHAVARRSIAAAWRHAECMSAMMIVALTRSRVGAKCEIARLVPSCVTCARVPRTQQLARCGAAR
jgi:hypothetical protein